MTTKKSGTWEDVAEVMAENGGETVGLYLDGHIGDEEARRLFTEYHAKTHGLDEMPIGIISQEWWRRVPSRNTDIDSRFVRSAGPGPGVFAVTHLELEPWNR